MGADACDPGAAPHNGGSQDERRPQHGDAEELGCGRGATRGRIEREARRHRMRRFLNRYAEENSGRDRIKPKKLGERRVEQHRDHGEHAARRRPCRRHRARGSRRGRARARRQPPPTRRRSRPSPRRPARARARARGLAPAAIRLPRVTMTLAASAVTVARSRYPQRLGRKSGSPAARPRCAGSGFSAISIPGREQRRRRPQRSEQHPEQQSPHHAAADEGRKSHRSRANRRAKRQTGTRSKSFRRRCRELATERDHSGDL